MPLFFILDTSVLAAKAWLARGLCKPSFATHIFIKIFWRDLATQVC